MNSRVKVVFGFFSVWIFFILLRLWVLQVVHHPRYVLLAEKNRTRKVIIPAPRGKMYDRNGFVLVDNKVNLQLVAIGSFIKGKDRLIDRLHKLTGLSREYISYKLDEARYRPFIPAVILKNMDKEVLTAVLENKPFLPGIDVRPSPRRVYTIGEAMAHITGYVGAVNEAELAKGYRWNDIIGRAGLERSLDGLLRGKPGYKVLQVDSKGNIVDVIKVEEPRKGTDIMLTVDYRLQMEFYNLLKDKRAAGILMDPTTGEILAMVSSPSFDPNEFVSPVRERFVNKVFSDPRKPLLNRVVGGLYQPGSVFKVIVALAGLAGHTITQRSLFYCDGKYRLGNHIFYCWLKRGHGWLDVRNALKFSCNDYFYQLGVKMGKDPILRMARRFGFGTLTGIPLTEEKRGLLPSGGRWYKGDTVNLAIGQGKILATPLQIACMMCGIAMDGKVPVPKLVKAVYTDKGEEERQTKLLQNNYLNRVYFDIIKEGLLKAVKDIDGTAHGACVDGLSVAGKTGTAELVPDRPDKRIVWFAGFAPVENPKVVVVVVVEGGESGGKTCAPIGSKILAKWKEFYSSGE